MGKVLIASGLGMIGASSLRLTEIWLGRPPLSLMGAIAFGVAGIVIWFIGTHGRAP